MRHTALLLALSLVLCFGATGRPLAAAPNAPREKQLRALVQGLIDAQRSYDQRRLRQLTANDYVEVSPRGEVDPREKMISFYAERPSAASPEIVVRFESVHTFGDIGVIVATMDMTLPDGKGGTRPTSLRASMVARCAGATCKLVLAQYTPVR